MFHSRSDSKIFPFLFSEVCFLSSGGRLLLHLGHLWYFLGTLWQQSRGGVLAEVYPKLADTHLNNIRPMASKKYLILIYPRLPLCLRSKRVMVEWIPKVCLYVREITRLVDRDPTFLVYSLFPFVYFVHVSLE